MASNANPGGTCWTPAIKFSNWRCCQRKRRGNLGLGGSGSPHWTTLELSHCKPEHSLAFASRNKGFQDSTCCAGETAAS
jgi:hypothetical protein